MTFEMHSMIFGILCGLFGRVAFAVFLLFFIQRVSRPRTYLIWIIIVLQVVVNVFVLAYVLARCATSVKGAWNAGICRTSGSMLVVEYVQGGRSSPFQAFGGIELICSSDQCDIKCLPHFSRCGLGPANTSLMVCKGKPWYSPFS